MTAKSKKATTSASQRSRSATTKQASTRGPNTASHKAHDISAVSKKQNAQRTSPPQARTSRLQSDQQSYESNSSNRQSSHPNYGRGRNDRQFNEDRYTNEGYNSGNSEREGNYEGEFASRSRQSRSEQTRSGSSSRANKSSRNANNESQRGEQFGNPNPSRGGRWSGESERYNSRHLEGRDWEDRDYFTHRDNDVSGDNDVRGYDRHDEDYRGRSRNARDDYSQRPGRNPPERYDTPDPYQSDRYQSGDDFRNHDQGYRYSNQGNQGYDRDDEDYNSETRSARGTNDGASRGYGSRAIRGYQGSGYDNDDEDYAPARSNNGRSNQNRSAQRGSSQARENNAWTGDPSRTEETARGRGRTRG